MGIQRYESKIHTLSKGYYTINRSGQAPAKISDQVEAELTIYLPQDEEYKGLHRDLQFGNRVEILYEKLDEGWGRVFGTTGNDFRWRYKSTSTTSTTWRGAFQFLMGMGDAHFEKLENALEDRRRALEDAEECRSDNNELGCDTGCIVCGGTSAKPAKTRIMTPPAVNGG